MKPEINYAAADWAMVALAILAIAFGYYWSN
jgi:hypothetical protein